MRKRHFLDILVLFRLDLGQISFNVLKNALASRQLGFLATSIAFYVILTRACAEIKILKVTYVLRLFDFWNFFRLSFFSFAFLFAAVIDLLMGLLAVKKTTKKASSRRATFTMGQPGVVAGNFGLSFFLHFLSIFVHISGSSRPITLIWASLDRSSLPAEVEHRSCQFW